MRRQSGDTKGESVCRVRDLRESAAVNDGSFVCKFWEGSGGNKKS